MRIKPPTLKCKMKDQVLKRKWIHGLRYGGYVQGMGCLEVDSAYHAYCCLGVLCKVAETKETSWANDSLLPPRLLRKFGLTHKAQVFLATMNDDGRVTFDDIADYIEENL